MTPPKGARRARPKPEPDPVQSPVNATPESPQEADVPPPLDGVVVTKTVDENGTISVDAQPIGNILVTEVQTLLELGVQGWRKRNGLGS